MAQSCINISGIATDTTGHPLSHAIIEAHSSKKNWYAISGNDGHFTIKACYRNDSIFLLPVMVVVSLIGYEKMELAVTRPKPENNVGAISLTTSSKELKEVFVTNKPVVKIKDTTSFNVASYKNKLDGNLEDVLRKMPGFDVDGSGNILYNNKPIEDILIEGDQLSKNYKLISKNITPDMIDKVEMIDKYNPNPVLKNLTNSQKQVMNLKLKNPNRLKAFGKVKSGVGIENKENAAGSLFVINKKIKTMAIGNINNIGENPYSEVVADDSYFQTTEYEFERNFSPKYITENALFTRQSMGTNNNSLFNRSKLGVLNNSYRPEKNTTIKLFTDVYGDRINQYQSGTITNFVYPDLSYNQNFQKDFKPFNINNNLQLKYLTNRSQLLVNAVYTNNEYREQDTISALLNYTAKLFSNYKRVGIGAYFTHRLDSNKALEISAQVLSDSKSQTYNLAQDKFGLLAPNYLVNQQNQDTYNRVGYYKAEAKYLFKTGNKVNQFSISNTFFNSLSTTKLGFHDSINKYQEPIMYQNDVGSKNNKLLFSYNNSINYKKLSVVCEAGILYYYNSFSASVNLKSNGKNQVFFMPQTTFTYSINKKQSLSLIGGSNTDNPNLSIVALNPILISYRSTQSNAVLQNHITKFKSLFSYAYRDFDKAYSFLISWYHSTQYQNQINNIQFSKDFDYYTSQFQNLSLHTDNIYTKMDKYFFAIKTSVSIKNSFTWYENPQKVNNILLSNKGMGYNLTLLVRPKMFSFANIELGLNYQLSKDESSNKKTYQLNPFADVSTTINKNLAFGFKYNYYYSNYVPDKKDYHFLDCYLWYTLKQNKLDLKGSFINAFNVHAIYYGYQNAFIASSIVTQTLPRFALIELVYKF